MTDTQIIRPCQDPVSLALNAHNLNTDSVCGVIEIAQDSGQGTTQWWVRGPIDDKNLRNAAHAKPTGGGAGQLGVSIVTGGNDGVAGGETVGGVVVIGGMEGEEFETREGGEKRGGGD